jgi:hypothetical protein
MMIWLDELVVHPNNTTRCLVDRLGKPPEHAHMRSWTKIMKGYELVNRWVESPMGKETRQMARFDAYKGTRAHNQEGILEESKKRYVILRRD